MHVYQVREETGPAYPLKYVEVIQDLPVHVHPDELENIHDSLKLGEAYILRYYIGRTPKHIIITN